MEPVIALATKNEMPQAVDFFFKLQTRHVITVDQSLDGTQKAAERFKHHKVYRQLDDGIASAYRAAVLLAAEEARGLRGGYVLQLDMGHPVSHIQQFSNALQSGYYDVILGQRMFYFQSPRTYLSVLAGKLMGIRDATCGMRAFRPEVVNSIWDEPFYSTGFAFQLEVLDRIRRAKIAVGLVNIPYKLDGNTSFKLKMVFEALKVYFQKGMYK